MSKSSIKVTYDIIVGPYDMRLTQEEAESLFEQLEEVLGKNKPAYYPPWPIPNEIPLPDAPTHPPQPVYPQYPTPTYPWHQVWCGMSMFPKDQNHVVNSL